MSEEKEAGLLVIKREGIIPQIVVKRKKIGMDKVEGGLKQTKSLKAARLYSIVLDMLKEGRKSTIEWLIRMCNEHLERREVLKD